MPPYSQRNSLLIEKPPPDSSRLHTLCLDYAANVASAKLSRILRVHRPLLPRALRSQSFMQTWRTAGRIGGSLINYRIEEQSSIFNASPQQRL